ncbi:uncharacterized protein LOC144706713 [Wolffia australiana]
MERNQDEAFRARYMAEEKTRSKDFSGAKKIIMTSRNLFPDLDNILVICEVLSAAEEKVNGYHNWYGILKLDPTADEIQIKRQYRKLALLLHPDKNKFFGSEDAFKLVGEAYRILSNRSKRNFYDMKMKMKTKTRLPVDIKQPTPRSKKDSNSCVHNSTSLIVKDQKIETSSVTSRTRLKIEIMEEDEAEKLQNHCSDRAAEIPHASPSVRRFMSLGLKVKDDNKIEEWIRSEILTSKIQTNDQKDESSLTTFISETEAKNSRGRINIVANLPVEIQVKGKRRKLQEADASLSKNSEETSLLVDLDKAEESIVEETPSKKRIKSSSPKVIGYPDSEFHDFELERTKGKLKTGQIWAVYSEIDGFPKYYAQITNIDLEQFKIRVTWLEAGQLSTEDRVWSTQGLPISCGRFKLSGEEGTEEYRTAWIFSHIIWPRRFGNDPFYEIYPQINEVWAIYKDWNLDSRVPNLEYELVEILSCDDSMAIVELLRKVDGFRSVFRRRKNNRFPDRMRIPRNEFLRFSHQIPSFRLTEERGGELKGFWELDSASLPESFIWRGRGGASVSRSVN